jgi:DNA-binding response OmpR family regulator
MKILIIEDEPPLAQSMAEYMKGENYLCEWAKNVKEGMEKIMLYDYDCVLLDITLPDGNGLEILKKLKELNKTEGVLILSAKGSIDDKVYGLKLGADDYLAKPFHMAEMDARVNAILRRRRFEGRDLLQFNEIRIDTAAKSLFVKDVEVSLTRKEYELLLFLIGNKNRVVSKNAIAEHLSGEDADYLNNFDFIYAHMKNLKKKLAEAGCTDYIRTVYGLGYKFMA